MSEGKGSEWREWREQGNSVHTKKKNSIDQGCQIPGLGATSGPSTPQIEPLTNYEYKLNFAVDVLNYYKLFIYQSSIVGHLRTKILFLQYLGF